MSVHVRVEWHDGIHVHLSLCQYNVYRVRTIFQKQISKTQIDFSRALKFTLTFLTDFQNFPRPVAFFPRLSSPGKCHNKIQDFPGFQDPYSTGRRYWAQNTRVMRVCVSETHASAFLTRIIFTLQALVYALKNQRNENSKLAVAKSSKESIITRFIARLN